MDSTRLNKRFRTYAKVRCQKYGSGSGALMILNDISKAGARLHLVSAAAEFLRGDILRLVVELDSVNRNRVVNAEVMWSKNGALGVFFLSPEMVVSKLLSKS